MSIRKPRKRHSTTPAELPQMPFDDALRRLLSAPPQHRKAKKKGKGRRG